MNTKATTYASGGFCVQGCDDLFERRIKYLRVE